MTGLTPEQEAFAIEILGKDGLECVQKKVNEIVKTIVESLDVESLERKPKC